MRTLTRGAAAAPSELELELQEWQKRYRIMEGDRKAYSEEAQSIIRKQRAQINKLKQDIEQLQGMVSSDTRDVAAFENTQAAQHLTSLADQKETFDKKLESERARQQELDEQTRALTQKIQEERLKLGGSNAEKEHHQQVSKQIKVLENRLEKHMVKFNESLTQNRALREEIDNLRRERLAFEQQFQKLEKQLSDRKAAMNELIEDSNRAYEQRDEAQQKIAELRERSEREHAEFEEKLNELQQQIATDKRNKDFLQLMQGRSQKAGGEDKKRKDLEKSRVQQSQMSSERVQSFEEAFEKIQEATNISDPNEFVTQFIKVEDQNFSLFNYVNELNTEIEKLEEQITETKNEIERYKGEGATTDTLRKQQLKELEDKLNATESKAATYDAKSQDHARLLSSLKTSIQEIFVKIGCDTSAISEMLGNQGVTDHNVMTYMGIIEQRANELLALYRTSQTAEGAPLPMAGPHTPLGASTVQPTALPSAGATNEDEYDDEDDGDRPLTRDELKQRTLRGADALSSSHLSESGKFSASSTLGVRASSKKRAALGSSASKFSAQ